MATELAKAYVQIIPSAKGIKSKIENEIGGAGAGAGTKLAGAIKTALVTAGIGKALGASLTEGAALQQSLGGIETMFKDSSAAVKKYADEAYATAGLSANAYMETVTSFSASLIKSLADDTEKAAEYANRALIDMSDNSNKFGTDMQSIQDAYQGFAKQNYTMLDNLKLGYGGTQEEMKKLIKDASQMTAVQEKLGVTVDESSLSFSNIVNAISVMQEEMGITGTTSLEAASTFTGSLNSMKASASNVLGNLALGKDIEPSLTNLVETTATFLGGNLLPMVGNILTSLPQAVTVGLEAAAAEIEWTEVASNIIGGFEFCISEEGLPRIFQSGTTMISEFVVGALESLPLVIDSGGAISSTLLQGIISCAPSILESGASLIGNLAMGIISNIPAVVGSAISTTVSLSGQLAAAAPELLQKGIELICELAAGIIKGIPDVVASIPEVISDIKAEFEEFDWLEIGSNIIGGIAKGILNGISTIASAAKEAAVSAYETAKEWLGIHSPSTKFEWLGLMSDEGYAGGIKRGTKLIDIAMEDVIRSTFPVHGVSAYSGATSAGGGGTIDALIERLDTIIYLLQILLEKEFNIILEKREVARALAEMGVVFS